MPPEKTDVPERRVSILYERTATLEEKLTSVQATLHTALQGKGGIQDRLEHMDECIEGVKRTVWMATGAVSFIVVIASLIIKHI